MKRYFLFIVIFCLCGCQTMTAKSKSESNKDVEKAIHSVASAVSGRELSEEDVKRLEKDLKENPQAQSAVQAITDSMDNQQKRVKYCPVDGERFSAHMSTCPKHNVELKFVE